ncbi:hypothetical protein I308_102288 [Cryptococcus tetragattii IND107]|uniref:Uncharacterized protein n=1 Tax=Cryptococcus tetragattii IND107 TaxID=1296105 RepID=A0ABR3BWY2_9TREE
MYSVYLLYFRPDGPLPCYNTTKPANYYESPSDLRKKAQNQLKRSMNDNQCGIKGSIIPIPPKLYQKKRKMGEMS